MDSTRDIDRSDAGGLRVMLVDDHAVSRSACRALLRTEGVDVVAELPLGEASIVAAYGLAPSAVIVDVTPGDPRALQLARQLRTLPRAPVVVLSSSADLSRFEPGLGAFPFVAKADLCRAAILEAIQRPGRPLGPQPTSATRRG